MNGGKVGQSNQRYRFPCDWYASQSIQALLIYRSLSLYSNKVVSSVVFDVPGDDDVLVDERIECE